MWRCSQSKTNRLLAFCKFFSILRRIYPVIPYSMLDWLSKIENWTRTKIHIHSKTVLADETSPREKKIFSAWEIWWCVLGQNIGVEIYGKWDTFSRPILILKKIGKYGFIGLPSTTKHENIRNKTMITSPIELEEWILSAFRYDQIRTFDTVRLQEKICDISDLRLREIQAAFYAYLIQKNAPAPTRDAGIG